MTGTPRVFSDGAPCVCAGCGKPLVLAREDALWFAVDAPDGQPKSYHVECRLKEGREKRC